MPDVSPSRKRRGRPSLQPGAPSAELHVRLPAALYDRLYSEASSRRISVAEMARRALARGVCVTENSDVLM